MIVNVFVYIERGKDVKCLGEVNLPWNGYITFEDREEMSGTDYGVHMHNGHDSIFVAVEIGFDNPHAIVGVGIVKGLVKFMTLGTRPPVLTRYLLSTLWFSV